jgi:hypothetical protein
MVAGECVALRDGLPVGWMLMLGGLAGELRSG